MTVTVMQCSAAGGVFEEIVYDWYADAAVDLDFENSTYLDSGGSVAVTTLLSCTRASIGYAQTAAGALTQFATNTLRITDAGLLVEDARTNLMLRSQEFHTNWSQDNLGVTADATTAPDGTTTADLIVPNTTSTYHRINTSFAPVSGTGTWSVYAKAGGYSWLAFTNAGGLIANFDLTNGVVGSLGGSVTATIEALANGWYRCRMTGTAVGGSDSIYTNINNVDSGSSQAHVIYAGNGTSGIYLWGAQFEQAAFPSSYIPTTSASATRAADVVTCSGGLQSTIAAATGSIVAQIDGGKLAGAAANVVDSNGTNLLGFDATNHGLASLVATLATSDTANRTTQDKLGIAWNASGRGLVLNNGTVATDSSAQTPSSTQRVGSSTSTNFIYAYVERLTVWDTRLADAALRDVTA